MAEYDYTVRERAENLYIKNGLTIAEIAKTTGVSERQLSRWSRDGGKQIDGQYCSGWRIRQKEYQEKKRTIDENLFEALEKLSKTAQENGDAQSVYAAVQLYKLETASRQQAKPVPIDKTLLYMEAFEWAIKYFTKKIPGMSSKIDKQAIETATIELKKWIKEKD